MLAKTGNVVIHHWAHVTAQPGCSAYGESEWHLAWKAEALDGTQEIAVGNRRADVLAPWGGAVEFQHSALTAEDVHSREDDWGHKLVWIMDGRAAAKGDNLVQFLGREGWSADTCPWGQYCREVFASERHTHFRWPRAPMFVKSARCPMIIDTGDGLVYVEKITTHVGGPLRGWGQRMTRAEVIEKVLRADSLDLPETPNLPPRPPRRLILRAVFRPDPPRPPKPQYDTVMFDTPIGPIPSWATTRGARPDNDVHHCQRWLDDESRWCRNPHCGGRWQVGWLCSNHAPVGASLLIESRELATQGEAL
jgi:hypothetical protein